MNIEKLEALMAEKAPDWQMSHELRVEAVAALPDLLDAYKLGKAYFDADEKYWMAYMAKKESEAVVSDYFRTQMAFRDYYARQKNGPMFSRSKHDT